MLLKPYEYELVRKPEPLAVGAYNVGYTVLDFLYMPVTGVDTPEFQKFGNENNTQDGKRKITVAVWYPTKDEEEPYDYNIFFGTPDKKFTSEVAFNGALAGENAPYPLVVFSHGGGGSGPQSLFAFEYLASQGYIVASPDHLDTCMSTIKGGSAGGKLVDYPGGRKVPESALPCLEFWEAEGFNPYDDFPSRPQDIKAVISEMLRLDKEQGEQADGPVFYQAVDENNIAVSGHSGGGWTTQVASGVVPDGYEYLSDERISAAFFFAPNTEWTNRHANDSYRKMEQPVMYLLGEYDQYSQSDLTTPRRDAYDGALPPKFLPIIRDVAHFEFSNWPTCVRYRTVDECIENSLKARTINKYSLAFLDRYMKNNLSAERILTTQAERDWMLLQPYEYDLGGGSEAHIPRFAES